ncbi:Fanconi anemia group B protein isoform 2-T2 [Pholidichthys leucotaenia]
MESLFSEDFYQEPHWLAHRGNIILFNCRRAPDADDSERSELLFRSLSFERGEQAFLRTADGVAVISRKPSARVDIIKCQCVTVVQRRASAPCILVTRKSETGHSFQYSVLTLVSFDRLEPCIEFKLPYQINKDVHILRGPTVLWGHEGGIFFTSPRAGGVRQVPLQSSRWVVGELSPHRGQVFVLGLRTLSDECSGSRPPGKTFGCLVEDGQVFDGAVVIPHPYVSITQCVLVLQTERVHGALKCSLVAATSQKQLVYFVNGLVKDVCELPLEQPESIRLVDTGRTGCLFVIANRQGRVCAIWKDTFQIASCWSDVVSVYVDDFLRCGTDQMLLVFGDRGVEEQLLEKFLITDLCGISFSSGRDTEAPKTSPLPPENYALTLQALESRLQSGLTMLEELQREVRVKDRVVQQSVRALTDVASGREPAVTQHQQEGLVSLWDCDDESKDEASDDKMQDMPAVSSKPQIDKLWHRSTEGRMVVGVILTTDSSVPMTNVSLSVLTETSQSSVPTVIQTRSQVFWLSAPSPSSSSSSSSSSSASTVPEPPAKKSKQHNASRPIDLNTRRLAVTAVTKLTPLLNSGCVKCRVMLHYVQTPDAFALASNPKPVVLHCGQIALDIHNDLHMQLLKNPQLKTDEIREDLMSLLTVLDCWVFHIDSPDYSLGDIDGWIQNSVGCKKIEVSPEYLLLNSSGSSALVLLQWRPITPFQGKLSVHARQLQLFQFLDLLLAHLPASCSVQPVKGPVGQDPVKILALALEKELASLRECTTSLLCEDQEEVKKNLGHEETLAPGCVEGLQRCREVWQRDVERSRRRLSPLVDVGRYRRIVQSISKVQLDGDLAALLDTHG